MAIYLLKRRGVRVSNSENTIENMERPAMMGRGMRYGKRKRNILQRILLIKTVCDYYGAIKNKIAVKFF